jgi:hypothetical protein
VWHVVKKAAMSLNIPRVAPHDLRRTCARLCHDAGGELEQIQFRLVHVSVQTTERYIGCKQHLRIAVNDPLGIDFALIDQVRPTARVISNHRSADRNQGPNFDFGNKIGHSRTLDVKAIHEYALFNLSRD